MPCVSGAYAGGGVVKKSPGSRKPWKNMSSAGEQPTSGIQGQNDSIKIEKPMISIKFGCESDLKVFYDTFD